MKKTLTFFILLLTAQLWSQYRPNNGVTASKANVILIKNANLYLGGSTNVLNAASILIKGDKIIEVGTKIKEPNSALIIDMEGRTIMPSFIELNSNIGVEKQSFEKKNNFAPQIESLKQNSFYWR